MLVEWDRRGQHCLEGEAVCFLRACTPSHEAGEVVSDRQKSRERQTGRVYLVKVNAKGTPSLGPAPAPASAAVSGSTLVTEMQRQTPWPQVPWP